MVAIAKYNEVFCKVLGVSEDVLPTLVYQSIESWDSVGHMALMASLEEMFDIAFDTDDIIDFSSYSKGLEIVKKYGVQF
jgi:acyl carrier protein